MISAQMDTRINHTQPTITNTPLTGFHALLLSVTAEAMAPHSSTLAWKIPWTEEPGTVKGFGIVKKAEIDFFWNSLAFPMIQKMLAI